jgi:hypothetical protein
VPYVSWTEYSKDVAQLGQDREQFGGTDALGMAAQKHVIEWMSSCPYKYVVAEGDRLANRKFFAAMLEQGHELHVIVLAPPQDVLERRRHKRNKQFGRTQDERWLKTRRTKVANLTAEADDVLESTELRVLLRQVGSYPVGTALRRLRKRARANVS